MGDGGKGGDGEAKEMAGERGGGGAGESRMGQGMTWIHWKAYDRVPPDAASTGRPSAH